MSKFISCTRCRNKKKEKWSTSGTFRNQSNICERPFCKSGTRLKAVNYFCKKGSNIDVWWGSKHAFRHNNFNPKMNFDAKSLILKSKLKIELDSLTISVSFLALISAENKISHTKWHVLNNSLMLALKG